MSTKLYKLNCEVCNWKKVADGNEAELYEYKLSPVMTNIPTDKSPKASFKNRLRKFRCPNCGRMLNILNITNEQQNINDSIDIEERRKNTFDNTRENE